MKHSLPTYTPPTPPRWLAKAWMLVRDGLPSVGRYRRYFVALAIPMAVIWGLTIAYILFAPDRYDSRMTLILPGTGVGGSINLESIGQATTNTSSAFSSPSLSPTENYKRLLTSDVVLRDAAERAGEAEGGFPAPGIKLIDQTNLIEVQIAAGDPETARDRMEALQAAFLDALESLRTDEAQRREDADAERIHELELKVDEAQKALLAFQAETGLVSLDQFAGRVTSLDRLKESERDRRVLVAESGAAAGRLASTLDISLGQARMAMRLKADPEFRELLSRYAKTSAEHTERGATLGDAHEAMEELGVERAALRDALSARGARVAGTSRSAVVAFADLAVSDTRERLFATLTERDAGRAGHGAALAELRRQISQESANSQQQVEQAARLADLTRDLRVAEAVFSSALARLDTNKSDPFASYPLVQTLEVPSLPRDRSSPSPMLAIAGAFGASLFTLFGFLLLWLRQPIIRKILPNA
ncbi:GumC family protein [Alteriqipengyuania sp. 357]